MRGNHLCQLLMDTSDCSLVSWFNSPRELSPPSSFLKLQKLRLYLVKQIFLNFSANCTEMYNLPDLNYIPRGEVETRAFCTSEFSDVSPLTNGVIPFSTLEGRPSAPDYDFEPQFWVSE